jgi:hypothetical protein
LQSKIFTVSFVYAPDQLKGRAEVEVEREDDEQVYLARSIGKAIEKHNRPAEE